jgi:hypothetical protein
LGGISIGISSTLGGRIGIVGRTEVCLDARCTFLKGLHMPTDPSDSFTPLFITQFETATGALPADHCAVTWANSEKGRVAAMVGPATGPFVVGLEEGAVWLMDKRSGGKLEVGPVADVTGAMVVNLIQDALGKRGGTA